MMECYSRTWGGDGNGLIATSSSWEVAEPFWRLLREFDPDHWAVFRRTPRGLRMSDPAAYESQLAIHLSDWIANFGGTEDDSRVLVETETFLSDGGSRVMVTPNDDLIRNWFAPFASPQVVVHAEFKADEPAPGGLVDMPQLTFRPSLSAEIDIAGLSPAVQLLVASRTGRLAPGHIAHLEMSPSFEHRQITVDDDDLSQLLEFAWTGQVDNSISKLVKDLTGDLDDLPEPAFALDEFLINTPMFQSKLGCSWFTKVRSDLDETPVVLICGDSAEDFCFSFTRQRVVGNTYWLPVFPGDTGGLNQVFRETITRVLNRYSVSPTGNRPVLISSLTLTTRELDVVLKELRETVWGRDFNSDEHGALTVRTCEPGELPVRRDVVLLDSDRFSDNLQEPFFGAELAKSLEIPLPSKAFGLRPESCRWQVDVELSDNVLPARWSIKPVITVGDSMSHWAVRSSSQGISVDSHGRGFVVGGSALTQLLVQVRLRFPEATEMFTSLLAESGVTLEESSAGRFTRRMIELWGSLQSLAADLKSGSVRNLLDCWVSGDSGDDVWKIQGRNYLGIEAASRLSGRNVDEARELLDRYLSRTIAFRGLVLKCQRCAQTSFYQLDDLGPGFRCVRCRQENELARGAWKGSDEPSWFYALDEVAYQGLVANVHVPILALSELSRSARSFLYMPEAVVHRSGQDDLELDLWAIVDGKIVVGEAKKSDKLVKSSKLEVKRCRQLRSLVKDLTADEFVMATASATWSTRTRGSVEKEVGSIAKVRWLENLR